MKFRDVELLSAYLDGRLSPSDSDRLKSRLDTDPELRAVLADLREARGLLHKLPQRRAPRNFTLTPKMAGLKPPAPRAYPTLRLAAVLATFLFVVTFAVDGLAPVASAGSLAAAPAYGYGMGGGGGGSGGAAESAPAATEAPVQPFAAMAPSMTPGQAPLQNDQATAPTEAPQPFAKGMAPQAGNSQPSQIRNQAPIPWTWPILLGVLALLCGGAALMLRWVNERKFRERWKRK